MKETVYVFTGQEMVDFLENYCGVHLNHSGREQLLGLLSDAAAKGELSKRTEQRTRIKNVEVFGKGQ